MGTVADRGVPASRIVQAVAALMVIAAGVGLAWVLWARVAHTFRTAKPVKVPTIHRVSGIVWAQRVFTSRVSFEGWLDAHGETYAAWSAHHPRLARVLETP